MAQCFNAINSHLIQFVEVNSVKVQSQNFGLFCRPVVAAAESWDFDGVEWIFTPHDETTSQKTEKDSDQLQEYRDVLGQQVGCIRSLITIKYGATTGELSQLKELLKTVEASGRVCFQQNKKQHSVGDLAILG